MKIRPRRKITAPIVFLFICGSTDDENHSTLTGKWRRSKPMVTPSRGIDLKDKSDLGQEFFRWEFAVAAAGAALGIHPFNQPDVQLAKDLAKKAMSEAGRQRPGKVKDRFRSPIAKLCARRLSLDRQEKARDYVAVQAYINPSVENAAKVQKLRASILQRLSVATTLGFGPRFLHSTGQLHKGGPNSVLVLQIVHQPTDNLSVPETNYTFEL